MILNHLGLALTALVSAFMLLAATPAMTRGEAATLLLAHELVQQEPVTDHPPPDDVPSDHPHRDSILTLLKYGVSNGCAQDRFCPDAPVTEAQWATFLMRWRAVLPPMTMDENHQAMNIFWGIETGLPSDPIDEPTAILWLETVLAPPPVFKPSSGNFSPGRGGGASVSYDPCHWDTNHVHDTRVYSTLYRDSRGDVKVMVTHEHEPSGFLSWVKTFHDEHDPDSPDYKTGFRTSCPEHHH